MNFSKRTALGLFCTGWLSACGAPTSPDPESIEEAQATLEAPPTKAVVLRSIASAPTTRVERQPQKVTFPYDYSSDPQKMKANEELKAKLVIPDNPDDLSVIVGDGVTGIEYQVIISADELARRGRAATMLGFDGQASPGNNDGPNLPRTASPAPGTHTQGLTPNGTSTDDRVRYGIDDGYSTTSASLARVVNVVGLGSGTGTLIGNRLVFTCGHCGFDNGTTSVTWPTITPRENSAMHVPYGSVGAQTYVYPTAYLSNNCHTTYTESGCAHNDWMVFILWSNPWSGSPIGSPGYMGYASSSDTTMSNWTSYLRGFPSCGGGPPAPPAAICQWGVIFGDTPCNQLSFLYQTSDWPYSNTNGGFLNRCDFSPGQSGSALFTYDAGTRGPYVIGNAVWQYWNTYGGSGMRFNSALVTYMNTLRSTYP